MFRLCAFFFPMLLLGVTKVSKPEVLTMYLETDQPNIKVRLRVLCHEREVASTEPVLSHGTLSFVPVGPGLCDCSAEARATLQTGRLRCV